MHSTLKVGIARGILFVEKLHSLPELLLATSTKCLEVSQLACLHAAWSLRGFEPSCNFVQDLV